MNHNLKVLIFLIILFTQLYAATVYAQSDDRNYQRIWIPRIAVKTEGELAAVAADPTKVQTSVQYFDGAGRSLQTVQVRASGDANKSIVQPFTYDQVGRESIKYMPFADNSSLPGNYISDAITKQSLYYSPEGVNTPNQQSNGIVGTSSPFSVTLFEPSTLNRVTQQGYPGKVWQPSSTRSSTTGRTTVLEYKFNDLSDFNTNLLINNLGSRKVSKYLIDPLGTLIRPSSPNDYYGINELFVTITKDENWLPANGCFGTVEEYKNKDGQVILRRSYNKAGLQAEMLSTYYIYDDFGNLLYVLPPVAADIVGLPSQTVLDNLCYQYKYDHRNRLIKKKLPGKGWEFLIYNQLDQLCMTQDANQRKKVPQEWTYTKYDRYGRIAISGIWLHNGSSADGNANAPNEIHFNWLQDVFNNTSSPLWEARDNSTTTGYTNVSLPQDAPAIYINLNYYDNYNVPGIQTTGRPSNASSMTKGLLTATRTAVLNSSSILLWKIFYYDEKSRVITTYNQHFKGGLNTVKNYDLINTTYNFNDQPTTVTRQHRVYNTTTTNSELKLTVYNRYQYDHMGRKTKTLQRITNAGQSNANEVMLSQLEYNEIGQLKTKYLHSTDTTSIINFKQRVDYKYNERGWLKSKDAGFFAMQLNYNDGAAAQFNGNISEQIWINPGSTNPNHIYAYTYDNLNRLTSGISADGYSEQGITYDKMGNLKSLTRYDNNQKIDELSYTYTIATNKLSSITDASSLQPTVSMKPGTWAYTYDGNGNMLTDASKSITANITYNMLNLPENIGSLNNTIYYYNAAGVKLRRRIGTTSTNYKSTDYIDGIQYSDNTNLDFIQTEEGRALPTGTDVYNYEYTLTDHLGNSRVGFDISNNTARIVQVNNYQPFGYEWLGASILMPKNNYLYNKKEKQENWKDVYDYGARFYDPILCRWLVVDPMAESREWLSGYNYVQNNPIIRVDPDGAFDWVKAGDYWVYNANITTDEQAAALGYDGFLKSGSIIEYGTIGGKGSGAVYLGDNARDIRYIGIVSPEINIVGHREGVGQPSLVEGAVPVWGSARSSIDHFQNGEWVQGSFQGAMAISDIFLVKSIMSAGIKLGAGFIAKSSVAGVGEISSKFGTTVIGEGMTRVEAAATNIPGSKILNDMPIFTGTKDQITSQMMQYNRKWILNELRSGRTILDIGLDAARPGHYGNSIFYQMEQNMIKNYQKLYPGSLNIVTP